MASPSEWRYLAVGTGVAVAAGVTGGTFARGLLPRSLSDQAMASAATAAYGLGAGTLAVSVVEATSELVATARGRGGNPETTALLTAAVLGACGLSAWRTLPNDSAAPLPVAAASSASFVLGGGSFVAALVMGTDRILAQFTGPRRHAVGIAAAAGVGGVLAAMRVRSLDARATRLGTPIEEPLLARPKGVKGTLKSLGLGAAVGGGLLGLAAAEFGIAEGTTRAVSHVLGRDDDPVTPLVGHAVAASTLVPLGGWALNRVRRRLQHADDIVEPAYPEPPSSVYVTAGPSSLIAFDDIGKEGRRFVLMALTADEISAVMGEPALDPIRAVAGFDAAPTSAARAELALAELEALGAYDRSVIVVAAPTGVGYVNYSFAEALEYLTRGDCAIIVPQYALVPSALALNQTNAGVALQTQVLAGIRDHIAQLPEGHRPRLLQFGESLGAQVALDVASDGTARFDELGIAAGLYLGTPFRTRLWEWWFEDPAAADPGGMLGAVTQADEIPRLAERVRHVQVIHHDDPINKFSYDAVVRAPWWMGPPETRPPLVPKETDFRPVTTFVLNLIDLKNGMNSKPGEFVRRGHDYRIELCDAIRHAFDLPATPEQVARIEQRLREREQEWAARRMVAQRFASARASVLSQLQKWGVDPSSVGLDDAPAGKLVKGDIAGLLSRLGSSGSG
ncbi:MAG TPA: alpha/beta-hydrolase family protein [Candidatus Nanopelagicales bacterium]